MLSSFIIMIKECWLCRNAVDVLYKLLKSGCETVIITLGENGVVYLSKHEKQPMHVLCERVKPVDTTVSYEGIIIQNTEILKML